MWLGESQGRMQNGIKKSNCMINVENNLGDGGEEKWCRPKQV